MVDEKRIECEVVFISMFLANSTADVDEFIFWKKMFLFLVLNCKSKQKKEKSLVKNNNIRCIIYENALKTNVNGK